MLSKQRASAESKSLFEIMELSPAPKTKAPPRSTGSKTGKALQSKALKPRAPKKAAKEAD